MIEYRPLWGKKMGNWIKIKERDCELFVKRLNLSIVSDKKYKEWNLLISIVYGKILSVLELVVLLPVDGM